MKLRRAVLTPLAAVAIASGVAACGGFDSAASGEHLIKDYVAKYGHRNVTVKSVSCPSSVSFKAGQSYDCKVTLFNKGQQRTGTGTITINMVSGTKVEIFGPQDIHVQ
jgi:hypothetical protein